SEARSLLAFRIGRLVAVRIRTLENMRPLPATVEAGHYVMQGRALLESGRDLEITKRAKAFFDKAVELDKDSVYGLLGAARSRISMAQTMARDDPARRALLAEANDEIEHALKVDPKAIAALHLRGSLARARGQIDRALASFDQALAVNPFNVFTYAEIG